MVRTSSAEVLLLTIFSTLSKSFFIPNLSGRKNNSALQRTATIKVRNTRTLALASMGILMTLVFLVPAESHDAYAATLSSVKTGTCTIPSGSSSVNCTISPALTDTSKTFMVFQATSSTDTPNSSSTRCYVANASTITCERNGTSSTIKIRWYTTEFSSGVTVQHLQPACTGPTTNVSIASVDMSKTFILFSFERNGDTQGGDDFRTIRLTSPTNVEIAFASGSCDATQQALQVVEYSGASVTRGLTSAMAAGTTTLPVTDLASVDTSKTMLLYSYRTNATADPDMCEAMIRGEITTASSLTFSRGNGASGCASTQIDNIAWERIEFTDGTEVQQVTAAMTAGSGSASVGISPVDTGKAITFAGGQWTAGQATGEGSYQSADYIGKMMGRHTLTSPTNLQVTRDVTGGTAKWTSYVVQFSATPASGTLVIVKDAVPDDPQDFSFTTGVGYDFLLDDDNDGTLSNTETFINLTPGLYTVTENPAGGFTLTSIICIDPDNGTTTNGTTASIDVDAGETVTCTYVNTKDEVGEPEADLTISKIDGPDPVMAGTQLTYTITVTNNGPDAAQNVQVQDILSTGVTFVNAISTQGSCSEAIGILTCNVGTVTVGSTVTITIVVNVNSSTTGSLSNTATVTSPTDPNSPKSSNTVTTTVNTSSNLSITKDASPDPVIAGNQLTYTILVTNNGPSDAQGVVVTDTLPSGVTFVNAVSTQGTCSETNGIITCSIGAVASGSTVTITITVNVNQDTTGQITNTVVVTTTTDDPNPDDNTTTVTTPVDPNPSQGSFIIINDAVPDDPQDFSFTTGAGFDFSLDDDNDGTLSNTETFGNLAPTVYTVTENQVAGFTLTNIICIDPDNGTTTNGATANIDIDAGETVTCTYVNTKDEVAEPEADLTISKIDTPDPVIAGSQLTYTILVTNNGPDAAQNVQVTDTSPSGVTFVSVTPSPECSEAAGTITCNIGSIANGDSVTITVIVNVNSSTTGSLSNTATVTGATSDPDNSDNSSTENTSVSTSSNLSITKTDSPDPVTAGQQLTYTITVNNNGPSDAQNVQVQDTLPAGVTFIDAVSTQGTCSEANDIVTCDIGTMQASSIVDITMTVGVNESTTGQITNTAVVTTTTTDSNPNNNTTTVITTVESNFGTQEADLSIAKTDSPDPVTAGSQLTYIISVTNNGPDAAQDVQVTDPLPSGVTFIDAVSTQGTCSEANGVVTCSIGTVTVGSTITITVIVVNVNSSTTGSLSNTATVTSPTDPNSPKSSNTVTTTVNTSSNLSITKDASPDPVTAGQQLTYTITVNNNGPSDAQNVQVQDTLPSGVTFIDAVSTQGTCSEADGVVTCDIGTMQASSAGTITIIVTVDQDTTGQITNTAVVTTTTDDPDLTDNTVTVTTAIGANTNLSISKTDSLDPVMPGQQIIYTVSVTNGGPDTATNVQVQDTLPSGVTFIDAVSTQGTCSEADGVVTCDIGTMQASSIVDITIIVTVDQDTTGSLLNTATVSGTINDPNLFDNTAIETTTVSANSGTFIIIKDTVPDDPQDFSFTTGAGFNFLLDDDNDGTLSNTATFVNLGPGVYTVTENPASGFTLTSIICIDPDNGTTTNGATANIDIDAGETVTCVYVNIKNGVGGEADLSISKTGTPDSVMAGQQLTYIISINNNGPNAAQNVQVTDPLPSGVTFVSAVSTQSTCTFNAGTVTCNLGNMTVGSTVTITITVNVNSSTTGSLSNTATVTSPTDPNSPKSSNTVTTTVNTSSNLSITKDASPDPVIAGNQLTYTILVTDNGPSDAQGVVVTDTLPAGVTFESVTPSAQCAETNGIVTCSLGTIASGSTFIVTITVNVDEDTTGQITNTAVVTTETPDPDPEDNTTTEITNASLRGKKGHPHGIFRHRYGFAFTGAANGFPEDKEPPVIGETITQPNNLKIFAKIHDDIAVKFANIVIGKTAYPMKPHAGNPLWWEGIIPPTDVPSGATISFKIVANDYNNNIAERSELINLGFNLDLDLNQETNPLASQTKSTLKPDVLMEVITIDGADIISDYTDTIIIKNNSDSGLNSVRLMLSPEIARSFHLDRYSVEYIPPKGAAMITFRSLGVPNVDAYGKISTYDGSVMVMAPNTKAVMLPVKIDSKRPTSFVWYGSGGVEQYSSAYAFFQYLHNKFDNAFHDDFAQKVASLAEIRYNKISLVNTILTGNSIEKSDIEVTTRSGSREIKGPSEEIIIKNLSDRTLTNVRVMVSGLGNPFLLDKYNIEKIEPDGEASIHMLSKVDLNKYAPRDYIGEIVIVPENGIPKTVPVHVPAKANHDSAEEFEVRVVGNEMMTAPDKIYIKNIGKRAADSVKVVLSDNLARMFSLSESSFKRIEAGQEVIVSLKYNAKDLKTFMNNLEGEISILSEHHNVHTVLTSIQWNRLETDNFVVYSRVTDKAVATRITELLEANYDEVISKLGETKTKSTIYLAGTMEELEKVNPSGNSYYSYANDVLFVCVCDNPEENAMKAFAYRLIINNNPSYYNREKILFDQGNWLVDGLAEYMVASIMGEDGLVKEHVDAYKEDPAELAWYGSATESQYGASYVFLKYLDERYGEKVIDEILKYLGSGQISNHRCDTLENCSILKAVYKAGGVDMNKGEQLNFAAIVQQWQQSLHGK